MRATFGNVSEDDWFDAGFRGLIRVSFGQAGSRGEVGTDGQSGHDLHFDGATSEALSQLKSAIAVACVGVRLVLTGPTTDIQAAAAVAAECGLVEEEVVLVGDGSEHLIVYCPHCRIINTTVEPVGSEVECRGCGTVLEITNHFSRRLAAYLGFAANAEEAA